MGGEVKRFADLGAEVARAEDRALAGHDAYLAVRDELVERAVARSGGGHRQTGVRRSRVVAAAALLAAAAAFLVIYYVRARPLTAWAGSVAVVPGALLSAPEKATLPVRFSDGSTVVLANASRGR